MWLDTVSVISEVWASIAMGTVLALIATGAGFAIGRVDTLPPVRLIAWWVRRVVLPLVRCRAWWRRAAGIFTNNISILAVLLTLGNWPIVPLFGVAAVGISLGIAIRVMLGSPTEPLVTGVNLSRSKRRLITLGMALNLLEPPAIMLTIGLTLARGTIPLASSQVWPTFIFWVLPATALAAGGEALWLGAGQAGRTSEPQVLSDEIHPDHEP